MKLDREGETVHAKTWLCIGNDKDGREVRNRLTCFAVVSNHHALESFSEMRPDLTCHSVHPEEMKTK